MPDIYERYGRKTEQLEKAVEAYISLLELIQDMKDSKVDINRVIIKGMDWELEE